MDTCFKTSNNKYFQCPPRMADGRHFTDYRPSNYINDLIRADNSISNSLQYRVFLQNNANTLMDKHRSIACNLNCCGTQANKEDFNNGNLNINGTDTMVPEQYKFTTDGRTAKFVINDVSGIGTGRNYNTYEQPDDACSSLPSGWPSSVNNTNDTKNQCTSPLDNFNYLGNYNPTPTGLRQAIPGGGAVLNL